VHDGARLASGVLLLEVEMSYLLTAAFVVATAFLFYGLGKIHGLNSQSRGHR